MVGDVAKNQALKLSAVDDNIMIEFQAFSVISAVVPTTTGEQQREQLLDQQQMILMLLCLWLCCFCFD